jgi:hypothetical protein
MKSDIDDGLDYCLRLDIDKRRQSPIQAYIERLENKSDGLQSYGALPMSIIRNCTSR